MNTELQVKLLEDGQVAMDVRFPTQLTREGLLEKVQQLLADPGLLASMPSGVPDAETSDDRPNGARGSLYGGLTSYLSQQRERIVKLNFAQLEEMLGFTLPASSKYRAWWANTESHSYANAWLSIGWKTARVDLENKSVEFHRVE